MKQARPSHLGDPPHRTGIGRSGMAEPTDSPPTALPRLGYALTSALNSGSTHAN